MCRSIKTLFNYEPAASDEEIHASAIRYVRTLSGFHRPSKANQEAFDRAVDEMVRATRTLLGSLVTTAAPRDREEEDAKARARSAERYGRRASA